MAARAARDAERLDVYDEEFLSDSVEKTVGVAYCTTEVLPCDLPDPDIAFENALPGGTAEGTTIEACRKITTGGSLVAVQNVGPVCFWARDSIVFGNGFSVVDGADFAAGFVRWAGYTP